MSDQLAIVVTLQPVWHSLSLSSFLKALDLSVSSPLNLADGSTHNSMNGLQCCTLNFQPVNFRTCRRYATVPIVHLPHFPVCTVPKPNHSGVLESSRPAFTLEC